MDVMKYIEINQEIVMGTPVIRGTRISVEIILGKLLNGETVEDIIIAYPLVSMEAISAVLLFVQSALKMIINLVDVT